ncbi:MAG: MFS transporter [Candidatus Melainabacteria bacterium]|nr:MFS transporter [Candidatus Melainabacteria bacterium]
MSSSTTFSVTEPNVQPIATSGGQTKWYLFWVFLGCWLGGIFDGMDSSLMHIVLPDAVGELVGKSVGTAVTSQVASWVSTLFLLGWMLGGIIFGRLGDTLGRVKAMVFSILLYSLFTGLCGFAHSWQELAAYRFLTGVGIGGELVSIATFLSEVWPKKTKAIAIGCLLTSYQVGVFLAGGLNFLLHDWRQVFFVGALPALLVLFLRLFLKESPLWVATQEAHAHTELLVDESGDPIAPPTLWQTLQEKGQMRSIVVGSLAFTGLLVGYWASLAWIPMWIHSLENVPANAKSLATMVQGSVAILGCLMGGPLCDWLGRRWAIALGGIGCFGASAWLFLGHSGAFSPSVYWGSGVLGFFIGLLQSSLYIYLPELFETKIRATATGTCLNLGRLVTAIAVLFMGVVVLGLGGYGNAAFAFGFSYLVGSLAMIWAKETKHLNLTH